MKILFAGLETSAVIRNLSLGLGELGHDVDTAIPVHNPFYKYSYTYEIPPHFFVRALAGESGDRPFLCSQIVPRDEFYEFVEPYDVVVFHTDDILLPGMSSIPILRRMGKKIIFRNTGSNGRFLYPGALLWNRYGALFNISGEEADYLQNPKGDWTNPQEYLGYVAYAYRIGPKLYKECVNALFTDVITNCPAHSSLNFSPFFLGLNTFDPQGIDPRIPARQKPVIIHAPSREAFKGTRDILACLEELRAEGLDFELVNPHKMPNRQLRKLLGMADIVINDLACGNHGILGNEAMAYGCAVLGTNSPEVAPLPLHRPVIPITRATLKAQIRRAVLDVPFRVRVAEAGIAYVNAVHHPARAAAYLLSCLERAAEKDYDYYPTLFLDNAFLPDYAGWIREHQIQFYAPDKDFTPGSWKEKIPPMLQELLCRALFKAGVHPHTDMEKFLAAGFVEKLQTRYLPRWDISRLRQVNPWLWLGENAGKGIASEEYIPFAELAGELQ